MFANRRYPWLMVAAFAIALFIAAPSRADDTAEVASYKLTEAGLSKYMQATRNLVPLGKELANCDDDTAMTLDAMVARLDAVPGAGAAIASAGMTTREYVVFGWAIVHNGMAAWLADQPDGTLPPDTSPANVEFYKAHEAALTEFAEQVDSDDCADTYDEDYDDEN